MTEAGLEFHYLFMAGAPIESAIPWAVSVKPDWLVLDSVSRATAASGAEGGENSSEAFIALLDQMEPVQAQEAVSL